MSMTEKLDNNRNASESLAFFRRHRIIRYSVELAIKTTYKTSVFMHHGFEGLKNVNDPEQAAGMVEGSIFASRLCYPNKKIGSLVYEQAGAGQLLSYDFKRPFEFPIAAKRSDFTQNGEGSLWSIIPESVEQQAKHIRTRNNFINLFSLEHILSVDKRKPEDLIKGGFIERRTHEQAYEQVGMVEYIDGLRERSVADELVYQVTPKGNTLLALIPDSGTKTPKKEPELSWGRIPGLIAH